MSSVPFFFFKYKQKIIETDTPEWDHPGYSICTSCTEATRNAWGSLSLTLVPTQWQTNVGLTHITKL